MLSTAMNRLLSISNFSLSGKYAIFQEKIYKTITKLQGKYL